MKVRTRADLLGKYAIPCTEGFVWLNDWHEGAWLSEVTGNEDDDDEQYNVVVYALDEPPNVLTKVASIDIDME